LSNDDQKSTVFSWLRNVVSSGALLTDDGRLFHARAEATGKARSPSVERLVDGITSMAESAERGWSLHSADTATDTEIESTKIKNVGKDL